MSKTGHARTACDLKIRDRNVFFKKVPIYNNELSECVDTVSRQSLQRCERCMVTQIMLSVPGVTSRVTLESAQELILNNLKVNKVTLKLPYFGEVLCTGYMIHVFKLTGRQNSQQVFRVLHLSDAREFLYSIIINIYLLYLREKCVICLTPGVMD